MEQQLAQANMSKYKTHEFNITEKENQIRKENQLLLEKLVEITHSKKVYSSQRWPQAKNLLESPPQEASISLPGTGKKRESTRKTLRSLKDYSKSIVLI